MGGLVGWGGGGVAGGLLAGKTYGGREGLSQASHDSGCIAFFEIPPLFHPGAITPLHITGKLLH